MSFPQFNSYLFHMGIAGRTWFDRLQEKWSDLVNFKTKGQIFCIKNDPITMKQWVHERDFYTRIQLQTKLFSSRKYIFVMEAKSFLMQVTNSVELSVLVMYFDILLYYIPTSTLALKPQQSINRIFQTLNQYDIHSVDDTQGNRSKVRSEMVKLEIKN